MIEIYFQQKIVIPTGSINISKRVIRSSITNGASMEKKVPDGITIGEH